ncbi:MAG: hypothetical protein IKU47_03470 [Oscillospiraceae bacterium]|nr:hypothetical protein [Oscillospiraceae bacterium]
MAKISRNPTIAYQQGFQAGLQEHIDYAYIADEIISEISYYNVIDDFIKTKKTQKGLLLALIEEKMRVKKEFAKDEDLIAVVIRDINKVRAEFDIPLFQWKK